MIDPQAKPISYLRLMILVALLGVGGDGFNKACYRPAACHRLERRLYLPDHVRQRRPGHGGEPHISHIPVAVIVEATMAGALVAA
jgi:hypothetical protein